MKGDKKVIEYLNKVLTNELTAINQYFLHARMLKDWGLEKMAEHEYEESVDEMKHADVLIQRILFLEGVPNMKPSQISVGANVPEILKNDLAVELAVVENLREAIALCEAENDYISRDTLVPMLEDTEQDHAHWLEQQLGLIEKAGLQNYLQSQAG